MKTEINIHSNSLHTCGVITGFYMLDKKGMLNLTINDKRQSEKMVDAVIDVAINGKKIVFDLADGYCYDNIKQIEEYFSDADVIFKRSFSENKNKQFDDEIAKKIKPYGFNYFVTYKNNPITKRNFSVNNMLKTLKLTNSYVKDFEAPVLKNNNNPKILFLTRLWNPNGEDIKGNNELKEERMYINEVRSETVKLLKNEFGKSFFGGIYADDFSMKYCPELLVDKSVSLKRIYLNRMKNSDICVNTMGLHGSIGWKTAEYIASARAVVSEKFMYETTGDFEENKNYLSFSTPQQCVEKVDFLMKNSDVRMEMSRQNKKYYEEYLRPDSQVKRALDNVFKEEI